MVPRGYFHERIGNGFLTRLAGFVPPRLKHQNPPEMVLPGAFPGKVLGPFLANRWCLKESVFPDPPFAKQGLRPLPQRAAQPAIEWNAKTGLHARDLRPGHILGEQLAEDPFPLMTAEFHGHRKPPRELDNARIE